MHLADAARALSTPTKLNADAPFLPPETLTARAFDRFDALMGQDTRLALVALSGGPDSTALLVLLARWCQARQRSAPHGLVVDHGLRSDARVEAERVVARWQGYLGCQLECRTLDPKPAPSQDALRQARYAALTQASISKGAGLVLTGHQFDDQLETRLERLSRGSNVAGLVGLADERLLFPDPEAPRLLRPLLFTPKAALLAFLESEGMSYERDPSNASTRYARGRWRASLPALAGQGVSLAALAALADASAALLDRQGRCIGTLLADHARWRDGWLLEIDRAPLEALEPATRIALVSGLSQLLGWRGYPALRSDLSRLQTGLHLSLNRCLLLVRKHHVYLARDPRCLQDMGRGPWQVAPASSDPTVRITPAIKVERSAWPEELDPGSLPHTLAQYAPVVRNSRGNWQLATKSVLALAPQFHKVDHSYRLVTSAMQLRFSSHP